MDDERPSSRANYKSGSRKRTNSESDNRKFKRPNINHKSINAKTIDTIYRILCPAKKIGSVLGKGGEIVNALREETRAKIRVADSIPGADERVVIIFNYLEQESENRDAKLDTGNIYPSGGDSQEIKPYCPAQDALLKIHDRVAADEYIHGGVLHEMTEHDDVVTARILVPNNQVGCLIGKGGDVIQKLRGDTNANIKILPSEHLPPCAMSSDELVQVSGVPGIVRRALYEISTLLHHHPRKNNPPLEDIVSASTQELYPSGRAVPSVPHGYSMLSRFTPPPPWFDRYTNESYTHGPSSFNGSHVRNKNGIEEEFSMKILCATDKIGGIIGKGGANVRQLERQTGASIHVQGSDPDDEERVIVVTSKEAPLNPISPTIEAVLQLQRRTGDISGKGTITTRLLVSSGKIGCILGQGGNIITEMRRRTRADIRVFSKNDKPKYASADEELVQISGNQNVAEAALSEIASRLRTRTLERGPAATPLPPRHLHEFPSSERLHGRGWQSPAFAGAPDSVAYSYPRGYDYLKDSDYPRDYDHSKGYGYPRSYDYSESYEQPKGYDYQHSYDYPKDPDYMKSYDYQKDALGQRYDSQSYPGPPHPTGYSSLNSSMEVKTPNGAILGIGESKRF
ncbi:KH domain-containing protein [Apostasia shenzhenica]|uniref:KH domain-containing protein n=1 Tax=Apostasia shenzhenica TaxID=1088818 RepID=A0A2I0B0X1_9ASPA|nr:KH domain-containing protein [Apostasia shenzhenica]